MKVATFTGPNRFLSNFYAVHVLFDGETYPSVEHAYQAAKTLDKSWRHAMQDAPTAGESKRLGKLAPLRWDWDTLRLSVMDNLLRQKFSEQNPQLERWLIDTADTELEEGNWWGDTFWGVCDGVGDNHLGQLLMKIRKERQQPLRLA